MKLKSFFSCCFRTWVVLLIGGFGLCSAAFGDAQYVTWSNIGLGYATAGTNTPSFRYSSLITEGNYQFAAYYEPDDGNNSNGVNDGVAVFARRTLGTDTWQTYRTSFKANTLSDGHDTISFGIDGDGVIHMSWGMHGDAFHYSKTAASVLNSDPITFGADLGTMTGGGNESGTTYPQFYRLPDGNLLYLFRTGGSGNGDTKINRYDTGSDTWSRVQTPLIDGYVSGGGYPSVNAYTNTMVLDAQGNLQLTWCWRTGSDSTCGFTDYQSNHNICYAKSSDQGATWKKMDNTAYTLPIWEGTAETVIPIPEGSSLINQTSMTVDKNNRPLLATWWAQGARQLYPPIHAGLLRRLAVANFTNHQSTDRIQTSRRQGRRTGASDCAHRPGRPRVGSDALQGTQQCGNRGLQLRPAKLDPFGFNHAKFRRL